MPMPMPMPTKLAVPQTTHASVKEVAHDAGESGDVDPDIPSLAVYACRRPGAYVLLVGLMVEWNGAFSELRTGMRYDAPSTLRVEDWVDDTHALIAEAVQTAQGRGGRLVRLAAFIRVPESFRQRIHSPLGDSFANLDSRDGHRWLERYFNSAKRAEDADRQVTADVSGRPISH